MSDNYKSRADLRGKPLCLACYIADPVISQKEQKILFRGIAGESGVLLECRVCGAYVENGGMRDERTGTDFAGD